MYITWVHRFFGGSHWNLDFFLRMPSQLPEQYDHRPTILHRHSWYSYYSSIREGTSISSFSLGNIWMCTNCKYKTCCPFSFLHKTLNIKSVQTSAHISNWNHKHNTVSAKRKEFNGEINNTCHSAPSTFGSSLRRQCCHLWLQFTRTASSYRQKEISVNVDIQFLNHFFKTNLLQI